VKIRGDLKEVEHLIIRLISIGKEFEKKDSEWSHLKNKEDFDKIYRIDDFSKRSKLEKIYADGRDMALYMSEALQTINTDFTEYPSINSIIERFQKSWVYDDLNPTIEEAKNASSELQLNNWSFRQMLGLFEDQTNLLKAISNTLDLLKNSDLYKQENGEKMPKKNQSINFGNVTNSNINLNSNNVSQTNISINEIFDKIIETIENSKIENKSEIIQATKEMESGLKKGSFAEAYKNFISLAADHITILAPFLPALSNLL